MTPLKSATSALVLHGEKSGSKVLKQFLTTRSVNSANADRQLSKSSSLRKEGMDGAQNGDILCWYKRHSGDIRTGLNERTEATFRGKNEVFFSPSSTLIGTMATETDIFIEVDAIMRIAHKSTLISLGPLWSYSLLTGGLLGSGNVVTSSECHFFFA